MTANRLKTFATDLFALAAFIAAVSGSLPQDWQNGALAVAALITTTLTTLGFQRGAQKYDALTAIPPGGGDGLENADLAFIEDGLPDVEHTPPDKAATDEGDKGSV